MKTKLSRVGTCHVPLLAKVRTCLIVSTDTPQGMARRSRLISSSTIPQLCARTLSFVLDAEAADHLDSLKRVAIACLLERDDHVLVLQDSTRAPRQIVPSLASCFADVDRFITARDDWDAITLGSMARMSSAGSVTRMNTPLLFSHAMILKRRVFHSLFEDMSLPPDSLLDDFVAAKSFSVYGHRHPLLLREMDRTLVHVNPSFRCLLSNRRGWNFLYALNRNPTLVATSGVCAITLVVTRVASLLIATVPNDGLLGFRPPSTTGRGTALSPPPHQRRVSSLSRHMSPALDLDRRCSQRGADTAASSSDGGVASIPADVSNAPPMSILRGGVSSKPTILRSVHTKPDESRIHDDPRANSNVVSSQSVRGGDSSTVGRETRGERCLPLLGTRRASVRVGALSAHSHVTSDGERVGQNDTDPLRRVAKDATPVSQHS